ncbi:MAG: leucine-rich repeat domain-containing protein [Clostridia bacterium]|nr:leucine-rich repeat domain-containing protein [Clostridia bacterium]
MLVLAAVSINALVGDNGIITNAQNAKIQSEETALWEEIQMVLAAAQIDELYGQDFIDFCNESFRTRELQAQVQLKDDNYVLTWGKNSTKMVLTNEKLRILKEYAIVEGSADDWEYEVKSDGTLKLTAYKKEKTGAITIPNTIEAYLVTELGDNVFRNASGITEVIFSDGLEIIGTSAFANCTNIVNEIHFSTTLQEIKDTAFYGCTNMGGNLNEIVALKLKLGKNVFGSCAKLTGDISVLMATLDENATTITEGQFSGFSGVTGKLVIPKRITKIENNAFNGCRNIEGLEFEEDSELTEIGDYSFYQCTNIAGTLTIPDRVISIGGYAFCGDGKITSLSLNDELEKLGSSCFYSCVKISGTLVIPAKIRKIPNYAFTSNGVTTLKFITNTVDEDNTLEIAGYAFNSCPNLENLYFPEEDIVFSGSYHFNSCTKLKNIYNSDYIKDMQGSYHFQSCTALEEISLKNTSKIGVASFRFCSNLKSVKNMSAVTLIDTDAFTDCINLETVNSYSNIVTFLNNSMITTLGGNAFLNCAKLTGNYEKTISNKSNITINLGAAAFSGTGVTNSMVFDLEGKTAIANGAFSGATTITDKDGNEIKNIVIPSTITSIGSSAFAGCTTLESVVIPSSVELIGGSAFRGCTNLSSVTYSTNSKLTYVNSWCFAECSSLTSFDFSSNIVNLNSYAFYHSGIVSADLSNVATIDADAFYYCRSLKSVTLGTNLQTLSYRAFANCDVLRGTIEVVDGVEIVKSLVIGNKVTTIGDEVFTGCQKLESIVIGTGITELSQSLFNNCIALTKVDFLNPNITTIADSCFYKCSNLSSFNINWGNLDSIGAAAFYQCLKLTGQITLKSTCYYNIENSFSGCPLSIT